VVLWFRQKPWRRGCNDRQHMCCLYYHRGRQTAHVLSLLPSRQTDSTCAVSTAIAAGRSAVPCRTSDTDFLTKSDTICAELGLGKCGPTATASSKLRPNHRPGPKQRHRPCTNASHAKNKPDNLWKLPQAKGNRKASAFDLKCGIPAPWGVSATSFLGQNRTDNPDPAKPTSGLLF